MPDHLILLVNDLEKAAANFVALGFTVLKRDDSTHGSSIYRFVCLDDGSYILITSFTDADALKKHRLGPLLAANEGWGDYSFTVDDVAATTTALTGIGAKTAGPVDVGNVLADGSKWSLKLLMTGRGTGGDDALPFVVEDVEGRSFRIPAPVPHANGATAIARMVIASPTAAETAKVLAHLVSSTVEDGIAYKGKTAYEIKVGGYDIVVFQDDPAAPLGHIGGGLYDVILRGTKTVDAMDAGLLHGALLTIIAG